MATIKDRHNPSFILLPVNNNRTAWRPFGLPVVMVVPHRRTIYNESIENSEAFNIKIYIENVPKEARVAGHDHIGEKQPDKELYTRELNSIELIDRLIDLNNFPFFDENGNTKDRTEAKEGSVFQLTTSSEVIDLIPYYKDADYYDLSDILLEVELLPVDRYNIVYQSEYFSRVISQDELQEFLCINIENLATTRLKFQINHPGEVLNEFYNSTPPPYLTNGSKSEDTTVALYRPFTDIIQDIYDEQGILERINWVFDAPAESIPYISSLLGWDLPYFPKSLDALRRAVLRRTTEFQNLAGSKRAIVNIFKLFGFEILISNLWWSSDGKRFIRPGERLTAPYENEEIKVKNACQIDLVFDSNKYTKPEFVQLQAPLLFRPQIKLSLDDNLSINDGGNITIESYLVTKNSTADLKLKQITANIYENPENFGAETGCFIDINGFLNSDIIYDELNEENIDGSSKLLIEGKQQNTETYSHSPSLELLTGEPPLTKNNVSFNRETNILTITLNNYFNPNEQSIYIFANYEREILEVPDIIKNLQSNRFDVQILTQTFVESADPTTLEFAIEFLFRLKAFHSLLYLIRTKTELIETYEVTDWCVGGDTTMRYDTDAGMLQVPPAIIPNIPGAIDDCTLLDPLNLGYKEEDLKLRLRKLLNLPEEFEAWKKLNNRPSNNADGLTLKPMQPRNNADFKYTHHGQDKIAPNRIEARGVEHGPGPNASRQITGNPSPRISPYSIANNGEYDATNELASTNNNSGAYSSFNREFTETRTPATAENADYCYKGRLDDEFLFRNSIVDADHPRMKPCSIGTGTGVYYLYPSYPTISVQGTKKPCPSSRTQRTRFSGRSSNNQQHFTTDLQGYYLTADYGAPLHNQQNSHLGRLYRSYGVPTEQTIHYHNRRENPNPDQRHNLAIERPSLVVEKPIMHLPGCNFLFMNRLANDFEHDTWDARPWDNQYSTYCGPKYVCGKDEPSFLNAELVDNEDGSQNLVFDSLMFKILGNGLTPILENFGGATNDEELIHAVYMSGSSPYVIFDQVDEPITQTMIIEDPLFNSHNNCGTGLSDYSDGYPSQIGMFEIAKEELQLAYDNWGDLLAYVDFPRTSDSNVQLYCKFGSGIRDSSVMALRFDCGCLLVDCDGTSQSGDAICSIDMFLDQDGEYDWEPDHLEYDLNLKLNESVNTCSTMFDGTIPSFLEIF